MKPCPTCPNSVPANFLPEQQCSVCLRAGSFKTRNTVARIERRLKKKTL